MSRNIIIISTNTPTHSYMKFLYKYPQSEFPYEKLKEENSKRDKSQPEYELIDTGIFDENKYFDVFIEYAKADIEDICIKITAINRGKNPAPLHILPTVWFRNRWSWYEKCEKPSLEKSKSDAENLSAILSAKKDAAIFVFCAPVQRNLLFTENDTNFQKLYGSKNNSPYVKDGINDFIVEAKHDAVNPKTNGTKAAAHYHFKIAAGKSETIYLRLSRSES